MNGHAEQWHLAPVTRSEPPSTVIDRKHRERIEATCCQSTVLPEATTNQLTPKLQVPPQAKKTQDQPHEKDSAFILTFHAINFPRF